MHIFNDFNSTKYVLFLYAAELCQTRIEKGNASKMIMNEQNAMNVLHTTHTNYHEIRRKNIKNIVTAYC